MRLSLLPAYKKIFLQQLRKKLSSREIPCPLCGSVKYSRIFKIANVHMALFRDVFYEIVVRCCHCNFVYTNPRPSESALQRYYTEDYALEGKSVPNSIEQFLADSHNDIWFSKDRDLDLILAAKSSGRLLDVGCASGTLLWLARQRDFSVQGVEIDRRSADFVRDVLGINAFCGRLEEAGFENESFDVITMFHVLEHLPSPRLAVRNVRRMLARDGVFIAIVPNFDSWSSSKHGEKWIWLQPQNHYSHFTSQTLTDLFAREGLTCEIHSEEGRYGEAEIRESLPSSAVSALFDQLKGSELIAIGRKY